MFGSERLWGQRKLSASHSANTLSPLCSTATWICRPPCLAACLACCWRGCCSPRKSTVWTVTSSSPHPTSTHLCKNWWAGSLPRRTSIICNLYCNVLPSFKLGVWPTMGAWHTDRLDAGGLHEDGGWMITLERRRAAPSLVQHVVWVPLRSSQLARPSTQYSYSCPAAALQQYNCPFCRTAVMVPLWYDTCRGWV